MHSKGPWTVFNNHNAHWQIQAASVGKSYWSTLGSFCQRDEHPVHGGAITVETAKANATLAAAAPEMLEALRQAEAALAFAESYRELTSANDGERITAALVAVRDAMTKASNVAAQLEAA